MIKNEYNGGGQSQGETSIVNYLGGKIDDSVNKIKD